MTDNSDTQDIVETVATENTDAEGQEHEEAGQGEQGNQGAEQPKDDLEKPKRNRAQERIEQLARERAELKQKLAEYESKSKATEVKRPVLDDFEDYSKYEDALEEYHVAKAEQRVLDKLNQRESEKSQSQQARELETVIDELVDEGVDVQAYVEKSNILPDLPIQLNQFGLSLKDTLLLARDLMDDEQTYLEIAQMNPVQAAMKVGQIIEGKKSKSTPAVSKAPKPIKPVSANAPAKQDVHKLSDDEFLKARGLR